MRNKFIEVDSPMQPPSIAAWKDALVWLLQLQEETPEGVNAGYAPPEPGLFLNPQNDETKALYLSTWLKLHDILIHHIHASCQSFNPIINKRRTILGLQKTTVKEGTKSAQNKEIMLTLLRNAAALADTNTPSLSSRNLAWGKNSIESASTAAAQDRQGDFVGIIRD